MSTTKRAKKLNTELPILGDELPDGSSAGSGNETELSRIFSAEFENLDLMREFVREAAEICGLGDSAVYASQLAVDEAATNIIEHAYGGESPDEIQIFCEIKQDCLVIRLRDCGNPFEPSRVPAPDLDAELEDRDVGGLGLYFINQLMDEVDFEFDRDPETGKRCNILRMIKYKES